jgi:hypothetical protein
MDNAFNQELDLEEIMVEHSKRLEKMKKDLTEMRSSGATKDFVIKKLEERCNEMQD